MRKMTKVLLAASLTTVSLLGCSKKVSQPECDQLVEHYASLVVRENNPDASPEVVKAEQERERREAKGDDGFKNCTTEVQRSEFGCAMRSTTSEGVLRCLE